MDTVYPASTSALARGRRVRRAAQAPPRTRHRTVPVTFAEIKEVDEENEEASNEVGEERKRRPDVLEERLGRQFTEFRRRRAKAEALRERDVDAEGAPSAPAVVRAGSEPSALNRDPLHPEHT